MPNRFWEIDFLRGVAIVMMVIFHLLFDLATFGRSPIPLATGFWLYFARATATLFLLLVGISLVLSYNRAKPGRSVAALYLKYLKRGGWIFLWGLIITLITYLLFPDYVVVFGILHLIGAAIILALPFINLKLGNVLIGLTIMCGGLYLQTQRFNSAALVWLGFMPNNFQTLDYFPLLPWFGVVLIGVAAGNWLYPKNQPRLPWGAAPKNQPILLIAWLGRHSLFIYLVHQPLLLALLTILYRDFTLL